MISLSQEKEYSKESKSQECEKIEKCPDCLSVRLLRDYKLGELVCQDCGYVITSKITDSGPEWRSFDDEQRVKRTRVGAPTTYTIHDKGLSTVIDWHDRDAYGVKIKSGQMAQIYRLRKWQKKIRVSDPYEKNLSFALNEINKTSSNLNLPKSAWENASVIYRKALDKKLVRGRSIQDMAIASVYLSCRQCGISRNLKEIVKASNSSKKEISRCYRLLFNEFDCKIPIQKPGQYVPKLSNEMAYQGKAEEIANKIIAGARELKLISGRDPASIAAASSYMALALISEKKTQRGIAGAAHLTEVTVRNRYKELMRRLNITTTH